MTTPKLRIRASGYGGSGYYNPLTGEKVIGVTTAVGALDKPGLKQWVADQTAYYAVANADKLLLKSEEQGFNMLRWYHTRAKESDFDNPLIDLNYYHSGVLNDAAELGTSVHEWVEAYLTGGFPPELVRDEQVQMVEAFLEWESQHDVEAVSTEMTVFGQGYGGTLDMIVKIDGVTYLADLKGLPLDTKIPTPSGWTTMRDVREGDTVFGVSGKPCRVVAKSGVHHKPCLELVFDNGETVVCDEDHKWLVYTGQSNVMKPQVLTAREMKNRGIRGSSGQRDLRVPVARPIEMPEAELPLDPYVLGVWLGDGTATKAEITINNTNKSGIRAEIERRGWETDHRVYLSDEGKSEQSVRLIIGTQEHENPTPAPFKRILRELGVWGNKHIPAAYMRASYSQRLDLLRGLMDTDGGFNVARNGEAFIATTDRSVALQYRELIASLGNRPYLYENQVSWTHKGDKKWTTAYTVKFRPLWDNPFLTRDYPYPLASPTSAPSRRLVVDIREAEQVPTMCIEVDSPDHTYLFGETFIPTHNTSRAVQNTHIAQLAAYGAATVALQEVPAGTPDAVSYKDSWWVATSVPGFSKYGVLQIRPDDYDNQGKFIPAFCTLHEITQAEIDAGFELYLAAQNARIASKALADAQKGVER